MVSVNKHSFFSSILFVRISYKTIWVKKWSWYKTHWKMNAGRAKIGIFQKMRIKNLRWSVRSDLKKLDFSTLGTSKSTLSATFCATGVWGLIYITNWKCLEDKDDTFFWLLRSIDFHFGEVRSTQNVAFKYD